MTKIEQLDAAWADYEKVLDKHLSKPEGSKLYGFASFMAERCAPLGGHKALRAEAERELAELASLEEAANLS